MPVNVITIAKGGVILLYIKKDANEKTITIREACIEDAPLILQFIIDLATYEKAQYRGETSLVEN